MKTEKIFSLFANLLVNKKDNIYKYLIPLAIDNKIEKAIKIIKKYIKDDFKYNVNLFQLLFKSANYYKAIHLIDYLLQTYNNRDKDWKCYFLRMKASCYYFLKDYKNNITFRKKVLEICDDNEDKLELANAYFWNKKYNNAIKIYQELSEKQFYDPFVFGLILRSYRLSNDLNKAFNFFMKKKNIYERFFENNSNVLFEVAMVLKATKKYNTAINYFKRIYKLERDFSCLIDIGACFYELKDYKKAITYYKKYLKKDNLEIEAYENIINAYNHIGKEKESNLYIEKLKRIKKTKKNEEKKRKDF